MKLKTLEQFESKDPCECGGNCGCGKSVNEKFSFSKKEVEAAASLIASAISQADKVKAKVHHLEYDKGRGAGFDISIDGEESAGGSYVVKDNGDVVNAAIGNSHPNAVYNTIGNKDIADVFINMEKYESNTVTEAKEEPIVALLKLGLFASKGTGEKKLLRLSDDFEEIGDEQADEIASHLNMAIELFQDGYSKDAVSHFKKFNKACKDELALMKKQGLAESEVNEAKEMSKKEVRDLKIKINNARTIGKYFTKDEVEFLQSLFESEVNEAKKYKFKELAKAWEFVYGEDMEDEYEGFYQEVIGKHKNKVTKSDIAEIWSNVYGEDVTAEYGGFFDNLKENVNAATKLERFNNIEEANADGTISDDEDDAVENMLVDVEYMVDELVNYIKVETEKIGGPFRSPGMEAQCLKLVKATFKKHKVRL